MMVCATSKDTANQCGTPQSLVAEAQPFRHLYQKSPSPLIIPGLNAGNNFSTLQGIHAQNLQQVLRPCIRSQYNRAIIEHRINAPAPASPSRRQKTYQNIRHTRKKSQKKTRASLTRTVEAMNRGNERLAGLVGRYSDILSSQRHYVHVAGAVALRKQPWRFVDEQHLVV